MSVVEQKNEISLENDKKNVLEPIFSTQDSHKITLQGPKIFEGIK